MTAKVKSVLLLVGCKDMSTTNEEIIRKTQLVTHINLFCNAKKALRFLVQKSTRGAELPDIILIGSRLKKISSWDFLEKLRTIIPSASETEIHVINNDDSVTNVIKNSFHPLTKSIINTPIIEWEMKSILATYVEKQQMNVA